MSITESVEICRASNIDKRERLRKHSDDNISAKHVKRSQCMPLNELEDMITCPIHLGVMEDPRILQCGHVFCLNCLHNCITSFGNDFRCPVCRRVISINQRNISNLPPSIQTKQLTDCIIQAKTKLYARKYSNMEFLSNESIAETFSVSLETKRDLVKHLIKEISDYTKLHVPNPDLYAEQLERVLECIESPVYAAQPNPELENAVVHSTNTIELLNSNYELMDVETIRENMKKYCEYKPLRDINNFLMSLYCPVKDKIATTHLKLINDEPDILVWSYSQSNAIMTKSSDHGIQRFTIRVNRSVIKPDYIKIYDNTLYISGSVNEDEKKERRYYLVQCSLSGKVIRQAVFNGITCTTEIAGFHIDQRSGRLLVALPSVCKIAVLSNLLIETSEGFNFTDLHPKFVTQNPECGEIWITCPEDGKIIIIDEDSGSYRQLGTTQIYNAVPSDIIVTSDNRVIFLDSHANRVFWLRKRNEFILIQRINFTGNLYKQLNGRITSMIEVCSPGSNGKLLITTANRICLVRPAKTVGEHHPKHMLCNII